MAPWTRNRPSMDSDAAMTAAPHHRGEKAAAQPGRPRFHLLTWIRLHGVDLITMAAMGAVGLGVYMAPPAPSRSFPLLFKDGEVVYPEFAYPLRKEIIPIWLAAFIAFMAPFVFFCLFQIRRRSLEDLFTTTMGLLKSLITAAVFQVFLKWLIGGLRPHFYAVCKPVIPASASDSVGGVGYNYIMFDRKVCTGDKDQINDSLESFPSGHATAAFAGLIFLALYFNAQLKVMSAHNPAYWKMIFFFAPILGAVLIAGALTIDEFHNWYDVVAGGFIGTACALVAFRQTFAAIFDFRYNHLLLPRSTSLFHRTAIEGAPFFTYAPPPTDPAHLPVSREGGWAWGQEGAHGAPGDGAAFSAAAGPAAAAHTGAGGLTGRAEAGAVDGRRY